MAVLDNKKKIIQHKTHKKMQNYNKWNVWLIYNEL